MEAVILDEKIKFKAEHIPDKPGLSRTTCQG